MSEKRNRRKFPLEYKKQLVAEYLSGELSAEEIAAREGIGSGTVYKWKTQLEQKAKSDRIEDLEIAGSSPEQARRILELEEEIQAYQAKVAELTLHNDLLKKLDPNYQSEKRLSGYVETKKKLARSKRRAK